MSKLSSSKLNTPRRFERHLVIIGHTNVPHFNWVQLRIDQAYTLAIVHRPVKEELAHSMENNDKFLV